MSASPLDPLRVLFGDQLQELTGAVARGEVPLTTGVVNRLIAQKLGQANAPIISAVVETYPGERFSVQLRPRGPIPLLNVDVEIVRQPSLPSDATLGMRWSLRGLGRLALLAGPLVSFFKALPPGIRVDGDRLSVDLHTLMRLQGYGELVPLLTGVRVLTADRRFVVQFELRR